MHRVSPWFLLACLSLLVPAGCKVGASILAADGSQISGTLDVSDASVDRPDAPTDRPSDVAMDGADSATDTPAADAVTDAPATPPRPIAPPQATVT